MVDGRPNSVIFWQGKRFSSSSGFNGQIVGVDRSKLLLKQQRLQLLSLFLVSLCAFGFQLSLDEARAEPTPVPSTTPATTGTAGVSPRSSPSVRAVGVHTWNGDQRGNIFPKGTYAQRGDEIWIDCYSFKDWVNSLEKKPAKCEPKDLILYLDHVKLEGVSPFFWYDWTTWTSDVPPVEYKVTTVGFSLVRNDGSKEAWSHLLNKPSLNRKVVVSVGFPTGDEMPSELISDKPKASKQLEDLQKERSSISLSDVDALKENERLQQLERERLADQQFYLTVIPKFRTAIGLIVILVALIAFLVMARHTNIIRDPAAPRRPDGNRPYSLARGQMAFWFFLVITSYFFLWIVSGDMDTLNASVLGLIGISAGTALGSAFVDAAKPAPTSSSGNQPIVDVTRPHNEVLAELQKLRADTQQELEALQKARTLISASDRQALDDNEQQQNEVRKRLANYRWQSAYFGWPIWRGVLYDLLAENNQISFHRFQIFVWTLILGIIFVLNVYNELAMPQFSATLLGLLGVSAGTYIGFKLPENKTQ
jgi:hypothetical protein